MPSPDAFTEHRPLLFSIAYRMLGSVMDAEDMVQETYLRWQQAPAAEIDNTRAYLATTVTRLCIDHLRSARVRREQYVGPWLPEPLVSSEAADPAENAALADSLSVAFLLLLERLSPTDRAALLLHDVFDYSYDEVGRILGKSAAACRQIVHRARERVASGKPRFNATPEQVEQVTGRFLHACSAGDLQGLMLLLAPDATLWSDGGGKAAAARNVLEGAEHVARFLLGVLRKFPEPPAVQPTILNGQPGVITYAGGHPTGTLALDIDNGRIQAIYIVVNPDKLAALATEL